MATEDLKTTQEVAEWLRMNPKTLSAWRTLGKGPKFIRLGSKGIRYRISDIEDWLSRQSETVE
jgi:predicted DNA-binding transcriptional regulator AlpA